METDLKKSLYEKINKTNTALLIIDMINSCAAKECEIKKWNIAFSKIRKMAPKLKSFIEKYRKTINKNVIFINTVPWQEEFLPANINELYGNNPDARYYSSDKTGFAEKFFLFKPSKSDLIFTKNTYDSFADGKLNEILRNKKIEYLVITGIFGDGCVMATINGAFSKGYNMVILKDLIETSDVPMRRKIVEGMKKHTWPLMYGLTIESNEFLKTWKLT